DCDHFRVAEDVDPVYAETLMEAQACGVEAVCYDCDISVDEICVRRRLPLHLKAAKV
ncbi:MAG: DNA/RNA nuclease SfsA, partial [Pseudomonadota bacterium]|nr:DNA/RNA nuclease SfsA [Pseudomonadota bacterium]